MVEYQHERSGYPNRVQDDERGSLYFGCFLLAQGEDKGENT